MNEITSVSYPVFFIMLALAVLAMIVTQVGGGKTPLYGNVKKPSLRKIKKRMLLEDDGIIIGKFEGRYIVFGTEEFVSLIAPSRTGKDLGFVIPNALFIEDSLVVPDPKRQLFDTTSKHRKETLGQEVFMFDPYSLDSAQFNPYFYIVDAGPAMVGKIIDLATIIYAGGSTDDDASYWETSSIDLFIGVSLYMIETDGIEPSLDVALRIGGGDIVVRDMIHPGLSNGCIDALGRFEKLPDRQKGAVQGNFVAGLQPWSDPIVASAMRGNSFDFRNLCKNKDEKGNPLKKMTIYVCIKANKVPKATKILNMFFTTMINENTEDFRYDHPCVVLWNEFPVFGYIPIIDKSIGLIAGAGLRLCLIAQSMSQLSKPIPNGGYGAGAQTIMDQMGCKSVYTPRNIQDAKDISETIGYNTVENKSRSTKGFFEGTISKAQQAEILPQDLLQLDLKKQIIFRDGMSPLICDKIRWFEDHNFRGPLDDICEELAAIEGIPTKDEIEAITDAGLLRVKLTTRELPIEAKRVLKPKPEKKKKEVPKPAEDPKDFSKLPFITSNAKNKDIDSFADAFMLKCKNLTTGDE